MIEHVTRDYNKELSSVKKERKKNSAKILQRLVLRKHGLASAWSTHGPCNACVSKKSLFCAGNGYASERIEPCFFNSVFTLFFYSGFTRPLLMKTSNIGDSKYRTEEQARKGILDIVSKKDEVIC